MSVRCWIVSFLNNLYICYTPEPGRSMSNREAPLSLTIRSCSTNSSCSLLDPFWDTDGVPNCISVRKTYLKDAEHVRLHEQLCRPIKITIIMTRLLSPFGKQTIVCY